MRFLWLTLLFVIGSGLMLALNPAHAEFYIAGQVGATIPEDFNDIEGTGAAEGFQSSNLDLENSLVYGGKLGYFFSELNWLGLEVEGYSTTPDVDQQRVTITGPGSAASVVVSDTDVRVTTGAVNLIARYPGERVQPYLGAGVGVFFANVDGDGVEDSDVAPGLNALAGLRLFLAEHVAVFGEYKFNHVTLEFEDTIAGVTGGIEGDYDAHNFVGGLSLHF